MPALWPPPSHTPEAVESYCLYVVLVLETENERGSATVVITRPAVEV